MARSRNIKPGFFLNDDLALVEPLGRILFAGLWCIADREGRLEDRPRRIKAEVLPYDDCDIDELLNQLVKYGFIVRYEVDGEKYIQVINFSKHQNPHQNEKESEIPAPECSHTSTIQAPEQHTTSTKPASVRMEELEKETTNKPSVHGVLKDSHTSTIQAPECSDTNRADSLLLIPDSLNLIDDCPNHEQSPTNLSDGVTQEEREILKTLKDIDLYPFDYKKDIELVRQLSVEFPSIDTREEIKRFAVYKLDKPFKKNSNHRLQVRNWIEKAEEFKQERSGNSNGPSKKHIAGSDPAGKFRRFVKS